VADQDKRNKGRSAQSVRSRSQPARQADEPTPPAESAAGGAQRPGITPLEATLILAKRGRKEILPKLRRLLDAQPDLWRHFGNLALQTQEAWLQLIAGPNLLMAESIRRHLEEMRQELTGPKGSPLDRILVDRVLACYVAVLYFEAHEAQQPGGQNKRWDEYRLTRQDQAHRQLLSAVKALANVRQLASKSIQVELIHKSVAATPVIPVAKRDQPPIHAPQEPRPGAHATTPVAPRFVGINRCGGDRRPASHSSSDTAAVETATPLADTR